MSLLRNRLSGQAAACQRSAGPGGRIWLTPVACTGVLGTVVLLNLLLGAAELSPAELWNALWSGPESYSGQILWNLRLPRLLLALLVGMHFAVAGVILQAIMRNPLADANILGVSAGASLAAVAAFILAERLTGDSNPYSTAQLSQQYLPAIAIGGGLLAATLVYRLSWQGGVAPVRLVLSGIAVTSVLSAAVTGLLAGWGQGQTEMALIWLAGSLYGRDWEHLQILLPWTLAGLALLPLLLGPVSLMRLGDNLARSLGLRVECWRFIALAVAVLFAASAVGVVGPVGFVGLIVPHIARLLVGGELRQQLLLSLLLGALLVALADLAGRVLFLPTEIPIGVLTSLIGVPFFIHLLRRRG